MIYDKDEYLKPYAPLIDKRHQSAVLRRDQLAGYGRPLSDGANNHLYYGVHRGTHSTFFREWAPAATQMWIIGPFSAWRREDRFRMKRLEGGTWEIEIPNELVPHGTLFKWYVTWNGGEGERLPVYATRCVQDPDTKIFSAQVWAPAKAYQWKNDYGCPSIANPLIYEAHIGMSSEECKVSTFVEFEKNVLPRVCALGYNTIQLMALQEHPYYGSFGYQVSNFFALSSRFGTPEEFKHLVDTAHKKGIAVVMDVVHSHAVDNEMEGPGKIDGSEDLYFHSGARGRHPAWGSRCFDYGKEATVWMLLSNLKFWMQEYHLDGFRFDGVTSMIYYDHGLGRDFTDYSCYFNGSADEDAVLYLTLANLLIRELKPRAVVIAEDMSGMPGLAAPFSQGGVGFEYRMSMGVADHWIKWIKERQDQDWSMGEIWWELSGKRADERTISYAECHDQAMVGDKTIIFRLLDAEMYTSMNTGSRSLTIDRGIALHKMIRLVTIATAGDGYLCFMGNEFGHPEWIDFPRQGNDWSYFYARRQWSLSENPDLRYRHLLEFDKAMIHLFAKHNLLMEKPVQLYADEEKKVLIIGRGNCIFALNFNPAVSHTDFTFPAPAGSYRVVLDSDSGTFGGFERNDGALKHQTRKVDGRESLSLYLPSRTAVVLMKANDRKKR